MHPWEKKFCYTCTPKQIQTYHTQDYPRTQVYTPTLHPLPSHTQTLWHVVTHTQEHLPTPMHSHWTHTHPHFHPHPHPHTHTNTPWYKVCAWTATRACVNYTQTHSRTVWVWSVTSKTKIPEIVWSTIVHLNRAKRESKNCRAAWSTGFV